MIRYRKFQSKAENKTKGKWYPRAVPQDTVDLDGLCSHMASHNTPYSKGAIKGILTDMVGCIKEILLDGKSVKIDDLAIFSVGLRASGVEEVDKFDVNAQVKSVKLRARSSGELNAKKLGLEVKFKEMTEYKVETE